MFESWVVLWARSAGRACALDANDSPTPLSTHDGVVHSPGRAPGALRGRTHGTSRCAQPALLWHNTLLHTLQAAFDATRAAERWALEACTSPHATPTLTREHRSRFRSTRHLHAVPTVGHMRCTHCAVHTSPMRARWRPARCRSDSLAHGPLRSPLRCTALEPHRDRSRWRHGGSTCRHVCDHPGLNHGQVDRNKALNLYAEACRRKQTSKEAAQNIERMHTRLCVQAARAAHLTLASRHHTAWCSCLKSANAILVRNYQIWMIHSPINLRKSQKNHKLRFP